MNDFGTDGVERPVPLVLLPTGSNRDQHKVMAARTAQVAGIKYQFAHFMLVNDLEPVGHRHFEAFYQRVVQPL